MIYSQDWRVQKEKKDNNDEMSYNKNVRKSSGVACCRFNKTNNKLEILLIKKRYSYSFVAFVFGQYVKRDEKRLKLLFNGMTIQEKIDIMSLKFDLLWYKIWLEFPESALYEQESDDVIKSVDVWKSKYKQKAMSNYVPYNFNSMSRLDFYIKKKNKFESSFLTDNGKRLRSLIMDTKNSRLSWEIPKGRKNRKETVLDCAIREFKEETDIGIESYNIIFDIKPVIESFISINVTYIHNYYVAFTPKSFDPEVSFNSKQQVSEVADIKWVTLDEIKFIDHNGRLHKLVQRIFNIFGTKYKHVKNEN